VPDALPGAPRRDVPDELALPEPPADGGGGITLLASPPAVPFGLREVPGAPPEVTFGGGGTTSCVPKSFPMMLLTNEVLFVAVGGGGTIVCDVSGAPPLSSLRNSRVLSAEGGGAITDGAGMLSFAVRSLSRSGAEIGGGMTAVLFICTRDGDTSRLADVGAGGIMLPCRSGVERPRSRETRLGAGATTFEFSAGAVSVRSRDTFGAGAITLEFNAGATSRCSDWTFGAGGTIAAFSVGELRACSRETLFAAGATTFSERRGATREERRPSADGAPGAAFMAKRLATSALEEGSLRLGASTTLGASEAPRATRIVCVR